MCNGNAHLENVNFLRRQVSNALCYVAWNVRLALSTNST
jgi:hypothetical protein